MNYVSSKLWYCITIGRNLMSESEVELIATNGYWSYLYALKILDDRFELGEEAIVKAYQDSIQQQKYTICIGDNANYFYIYQYLGQYNNFLKRKGIDFELQ